MKKNKIRILNKIYLIFLIIAVIIILIFSFQVGNQIYYVINTNLGSKSTPSISDIADWKLKVTITY